MHGRYEIYLRPPRAFAVWPTNDDLTLVIGGWPYSEFDTNKRDIEGNLRKIFQLVPAFAERLRAAKREARLVGAAVPNFLRKPLRSGLGPGGGCRLNQGLHHRTGHHPTPSATPSCAPPRWTR